MTRKNSNHILATIPIKYPPDGNSFLCSLIDPDIKECDHYDIGEIQLYFGYYTNKRPPDGKKLLCSLIDPGIKEGDHYDTRKKIKKM